MNIYKKYMAMRSDLRYLWTVGVIVGLLLLLGQIFNW